MYVNQEKKNSQAHWYIFFLIDPITVSQKWLRNYTMRLTNGKHDTNLFIISLFIHLIRFNISEI